MKTTLNQIRDKSPCPYGWKKLLAHLGKTKADDEAISILTILESNGLDDALWCLPAVTGHDREIRLYAVWCARQVQHLLTDRRSLDALDVAERFANGLATDKELAAARAAAWAAASAESDAAGSAAWVESDASDASDAARAAAWAASDDASDAARAAAWAASDAIDAAWAAWAASDAAGSAASDAQEKQLRGVCAEIDAANDISILKEKNT